METPMPHAAENRLLQLLPESQRERMLSRAESLDSPRGRPMSWLGGHRRAHRTSTPSAAAAKEARKIAIFAAAKSAWSGNAAPAMNRVIAPGH
jgi:hypothetical protein